MAAAPATPAHTLYRLARRPGTELWTPWRYVGGGRYDDPTRQFRVLYAAAQRRAPFVELLAALRPSLTELAGRLTALPAGDADASTPLPGRLPADWHLGYVLLELRLPPAVPTLDLRAPAVHDHLRRELAATFLALGLTDFDMSDVLGRNRRLTQTIARWAHEQGYQALIYLSRLDPTLDCWAILEGAPITRVRAAPLTRGDPDLATTMARFGLTFDA